MKKPISFILLVFLVQITIAQKLDYGNDNDTFRICNALSGNNFLSDSSADTALDKILNVIGASKRFVLQSCSNINNAVALSYKGVRYIMYDPSFMQRISSSNDWVNMFILAHEVGHHINGHQVDVLLSDLEIAQVSLSQKRTQELEADEFAGFVLGRLGANLNDAISSVASMSDGDDSYSTHPSRSKRQAAIKKGFNESGGKVDSSRSVSKGETIDSPYSNSRFSGVTYVSIDYGEGIYTGYVSIASNLPFGYGEYRTSDGYIYNGEWSNGNHNGYGNESWANGASFEGYYVDDQRSGEGVGTDNDGNKYVGLFSNGMLANGVYYAKDYQDEGTWNEGAEIRITRTYKDGRIIEIGFLDESGGNGFTKYTGEGYTIKASFKDGYIKGSKKTNYRNEFSFDKYGYRKFRKMKSKNGFYDLHSYFTESIKQDLGIIEPIEINEYSASYSDLNRNAGKIVWNIDTMEARKILDMDYLYVPTDELNRAFNNFTYIGDLLGYGVQEWKDGSVYKGYFKGGTLLRAGYGEMDDTNSSYAGIWWDGKCNGYGVITDKNGNLIKGIFRNNEFFKKADFDLQFMQILLKDF